MTLELWDQIENKHIFQRDYKNRLFSQEVFSRTRPEVYIFLDRLQRHLEVADIVIHCLYESSGHVKGSQHYIGNAIDFHLKMKGYEDRRNTTYEDIVLLLIRTLSEMGASMYSVGIYPQWQNKGFHIDLRKKGKRWGVVNGKYTSFEEAMKYIKEEGI